MVALGVRSPAHLLGRESGGGREEVPEGEGRGGRRRKPSWRRGPNPANYEEGKKFGKKGGMEVIEATTSLFSSEKEESSVEGKGREVM